MNLNRHSLCPICHKHIGKGYYHSACSKIKQESMKASRVKPTKAKRLSAASVKHLGSLA